jgi:hypothetical protein
MSLVTPTKEDLYLNGDDITKHCHSERSEESRKMSFKTLFSGFFTSFRMTDKCKDVIGNPLDKERPLYKLK